jgi:putative cardiolipin synthase
LIGLRRSARNAAAVCALALLVALAGCAALPERPLTAEVSAPPAQTGPLQEWARRVQTTLGPLDTAHWLLDRNQLALNARLALTDEAAETLDVQYFIWQDDATGHLLASRLLDAADRGVKVRLLLDDFGVASSRASIVQLDAHPQIEVRVFNPWAARASRFGFALEFLARAKSLNPRMHNKTYIADGRFAIVGGRNIGDRYFGIYEPFVQNDLDVLVAGRVVEDIAASFDLFWNSAESFPIGLFRVPGGMPDIAATRERLTEAVAANGALLRSFAPRGADWRSFFDGLVDTGAPGRAELYIDSAEIHDPHAFRLYPRFKELVASAQREVLISSPYFIPDPEFRQLLRALVARGVRVAIVTNSLATNNHVVAHTGYKHWRRDVLSAGVELYELRADATALGYYVTPPATTDALGLHTKAVVVDGKRAFVGSPNVDPRSMNLNTEIGIEADSDELSRRVTALIARDMSPENAWRVTMDSEGWLTWSSGEEAVHRQPAKGFAQRAVEFLLNLLPLKKQA